jgi:hypothetical protein
MVREQQHPAASKKPEGGNNMKAILIPLAAVALSGAAMLAISATPTMSVGAPAAHVEGEKLDSGLGDLPHYRDWADKTGKAPVGAAASGQQLAQRR